MERTISDLNKIIQRFNSGFSYIGFPDYFEDIIGLLEINFQDEQASWISYWIYDLEYGKKWRMGSVTQDGKSIKLKTIKDLYNFLNKNKE